MSEHFTLLAHIADLGKELHDLRLELSKSHEIRDALTRRCAEQARHIAGLISLAEEERQPDALSAIAVMQRAGMR